MKMWKKVLYAITCFMLLTACQSSKPAFVNHPKPNLPGDFSPFSNADCPLNDFGSRKCSDGPLAALGCNNISAAPDISGGLSPAYPLATCVVDPYENTDQPGEANAAMLANGEYFYNAGGLVPAYIRYVIFRNNQFQLIKTEKEFQKIFAPIESPDEALSYVLIAGDLSAYYGLTKNPKYEYQVDVLEDTHVETTADGYLLYLYHYDAFGCGPHWTYAIEVHLSTAGVIKETSRTPVFKDPAEDELCVD